MGKNASRSNPICRSYTSIVILNAGVSIWATACDGQEHHSSYENEFEGTTGEGASDDSGDAVAQSSESNPPNQENISSLSPREERSRFLLHVA